MTQKVLKVGSSAAVTIPKKSLQGLGLKIGDRVHVEVDMKAKRVLVESARKVKPEVLDWSDRFIRQYRSALEALAEK